MNNVLAAYLKDMAELMLSRNFTLEDSMTATVVRAKTITTLGQLDGKRKNHLVRFLYEAQLLGGKPPSIDLTTADLSDVDFKNCELINVSFATCLLAGAVFQGSTLQNVRFPNAQLNGVSFDKTHLIETSFREANLDGASYTELRFDKVDLSAVTVTNTDFTGVKALLSIWWYVKGDNNILDRADMRQARFTGSGLINASFVETSVERADMDDIILRNGKKGIDTNLLENSGAVSRYDQCETNLWYTDSMIAGKPEDSFPYVF